MKEAFPIIRKRIKGPELGEFMLSIRRSGVRTEDLVFLCIGTDRSTGDSLGPLVGTMLEEAGYTQVLGTLEFPLDASNMVHRLTSLPLMKSGKSFIAIDACLGQSSSIASYQVSNQPMEPGKSVGRMLPPVGNYSIAAIVNHNEGNQYAILQGTSLYRIMTMAKEITVSIMDVFPLESAAGLISEGELG
ncbi:spore protease YyaC [Paenibacillus sp. FSL H8-0034]|uniref:spore protease YyaC n=1 Tax=Paenibacillus sp. FSL H8-0034 TaxID=2954671 RepID=UPI0030F62306